MVPFNPRLIHGSGESSFSGPTFEQVQSILFGFAETCFAGRRPNGDADDSDRQWLATQLKTWPVLTPQMVSQWVQARQMALFTLLQFSVMIIEDMQRRGAWTQLAPDELSQCRADQLAQPLLSSLATIQSIILD